MDDLTYYNMPHSFAVGREVEFYDGEADSAVLIIVEHSRDVDGRPLYMLAKNPIAPPKGLKLYSIGYLLYRLDAGWFVGNVSSQSFEATLKSFKVVPFEKTEHGVEFADLLKISIGELSNLSKEISKIPF